MAHARPPGWHRRGRLLTGEGGFSGLGPPLGACGPRGARRLLHGVHVWIYFHLGRTPRPPSRPSFRHRSPIDCLTESLSATLGLCFCSCSIEGETWTGARASSEVPRCETAHGRPETAAATCHPGGGVAALPRGLAHAPHSSLFILRELRTRREVSGSRGRPPPPTPARASPAAHASQGVGRALGPTTRPRHTTAAQRPSSIRARRPLRCSRPRPGAHATLVASSPRASRTPVFGDLGDLRATARAFRRPSHLAQRGTARLSPRCPRSPRRGRPHWPFLELPSGRLGALRRAAAVPSASGHLLLGPACSRRTFHLHLDFWLQTRTKNKPNLLTK